MTITDSALREGLDVLENSILKIFNDKIRHTGLVTNNLDKSLFFWINLSFKVKSDQIESGKLLDKVLGYKNVKVRVARH